METIESNIEKAAGVIIEEAGINALTVNTLALQLGIPKEELTTYFINDEDILKFMGLRLENNIQQLIGNIRAKNHAPEKELSNLFKGLSDFFNQKSYFLELMFADTIYENNPVSQVMISKIRKAVGQQLTQIIEKGKKVGVFKSQVATKHEVESILIRFRSFMSDIPLTNKMIRDFKKLRDKREKIIVERKREKEN